MRFKFPNRVRFLRKLPERLHARAAPAPFRPTV